MESSPLGIDGQCSVKTKTQNEMPQYTIRASVATNHSNHTNIKYGLQAAVVIQWAHIARRSPPRTNILIIFDENKFPRTTSLLAKKFFSPLWSLFGKNSNRRDSLNLQLHLIHNGIPSWNQDWLFKSLCEKVDFFEWKDRNVRWSFCGGSFQGRCAVSLVSRCFWGIYSLWLYFSRERYSIQHKNVGRQC